MGLVNYVNQSNEDMILALVNQSFAHFVLVRSPEFFLNVITYMKPTFLSFV